MTGSGASDSRSISHTICNCMRHAVSGHARTLFARPAQPDICIKRPAARCASMFAPKVSLYACASAGPQCSVLPHGIIMCRRVDRFLGKADRSSKVRRAAGAHIPIARRNSVHTAAAMVKEHSSQCNSDALVVTHNDFDLSVDFDSKTISGTVEVRALLAHRCVLSGHGGRCV
jgi:hypothetical protein